MSYYLHSHSTGSTIRLFSEYEDEAMEEALEILKYSIIWIDD